MNFELDQIPDHLKALNPHLSAPVANDKAVKTSGKGNQSGKPNKYGAKRTWSELIGRTFDSKGEAQRAEELYQLERAGEISDLEFQVKYKLCEKPRITVSIDFRYREEGELVLEDHKGVLTRDSRTKYAWLAEKTGLTVRIHKSNKRR